MHRGTKNGVLHSSMRSGNAMRKWGFLRETAEDAKKAGRDADTGLHRTGLDEYLAVIFPKVTDWVHDKLTGMMYDGKKLLTRPDYRSETLKLIVEFDGLQHYQSPDRIAADQRNTCRYEELGYRVVRIPYFIQLTNTAVRELFGVSIREELFDGAIPSLGKNGRNTPAYLCCAGVERMAKEFLRFPDQYETNLRALIAIEDETYSGVGMLQREIARLSIQKR